MYELVTLFQITPIIAANCSCCKRVSLVKLLADFTWTGSTGGLSVLFIIRQSSLELRHDIKTVTLHSVNHF